MQVNGNSFIHPYKQSGRWQDVNIKTSTKKCKFCGSLLHTYITMHGSKNVKYEYIK